MVSIVFPGHHAEVIPGSPIVISNAAADAFVSLSVSPIGIGPEDRQPRFDLKIDGNENSLVWAHLPKVLRPGPYFVTLAANGFASPPLPITILPASAAAWAAKLDQDIAAAHQKGPGVAGDPDNPFFSITTTVFDTPAYLLKDLAAHVCQQTFGDFEWLILDNGSQDSTVIAALQEIAMSDSRIRLDRIPSNIHIIPGNRYLLERAHGRYIVPVDSDDRLYQFALDTLAKASSAQNFPELLFSDEAKIAPNGDPVEYIWRPRYTKIETLSTCPAAHVLIFCRDLALANGVYTESYARGSHDWDTLLRLTDARGRVGTVRACLYGWRMHQASTALTGAAKSYINRSQEDVVRESIRRRGLGGLFRVGPAHEGVSGYVRAHRLPRAPKAVELDIVLSVEDSGTSLLASLSKCTYPEMSRIRIISVGGRLEPLTQQRIAAAAALAKLPEPVFVSASTDETLSAALREVLPESFAKLLLGGALEVATDHWIWQAIGALELDDNVGVVAGMIMNQTGKMVRNAGWAADGTGFAFVPGQNEPPEAIRGLRGVIRHAVLATSEGMLGIRRETMTKVGAPNGIDGASGLFGLEYGLRCQAAGIMVAIDPSIRALARESAVVPVTRRAPLTHALIQRYTEQLQQEWFFGTDILTRGKIDQTGIAEAKGTDDRASIATPLAALFQQARPLSFEFDPDLFNRPSLNVVLPTLCLDRMSGGPNTALNLAYRLALRGIPIRFVASDLPPDQDLAPLRQHILRLANASHWLPSVEFVDGHDRARPIAIGHRDVFFATAWWTAQMVMAQLPHMLADRFFYLIQDFEPILHPGSTFQALALETYNTAHIPVINHPLLLDYFSERKVGRFADPAHAAGALLFTPAVDRNLFKPATRRRGPCHPRRLLFYARPTSAPRNLFEIGTLALSRCVTNGALDEGEWEICGMGETFEPIPIGGRHVLQPLPWTDLKSYADQMSRADIVLSLMYAPHPSYPPFEMAACGGFAVTNSFETKTAGKIQRYSQNILVAEPTVGSVAEKIADAVDKVMDQRDRIDTLREHPSSWAESFAPILDRLVLHWDELVGHNGGAMSARAA